MSERRELVRPDATVAYWVNGPERAPVVVLLHGATLDHRSWAPQVDELAVRYRVVVPDLRGHGESVPRLAGLLAVDPSADEAAWSQYGSLLAAVDRLRVEIAAAARAMEPTLSS